MGSETGIREQWMDEPVFMIIVCEAGVSPAGCLLCHTSELEERDYMIQGE